MYGRTYHTYVSSTVSRHFCVKTKKLHHIPSRRIVYCRSGIDCEILLIANCVFPSLAIKRIACKRIHNEYILKKFCNHAPSACVLMHSHT